MCGFSEFNWKEISLFYSTKGRCLINRSRGPSDVSTLGMYRVPSGLVIMPMATFV